MLWISYKWVWTANSGVCSKCKQRPKGFKLQSGINYFNFSLSRYCLVPMWRPFWILNTRSRYRRSRKDEYENIGNSGNIWSFSKVKLTCENMWNYHSMHLSFSLAEATTCPANNFLQIVDLSCVVPSKCANTILLSTRAIVTMLPYANVLRVCNTLLHYLLHFITLYFHLFCLHSGFGFLFSSGQVPSVCRHVPEGDNQSWCVQTDHGGVCKVRVLS